MFFDFQESSILGGVVSFPDWAYTDNPKPPEDIIEMSNLTGTSSQTSTTMAGSVND